MRAYYYTVWPHLLQAVSGVNVTKDEEKVSLVPVFDFGTANSEVAERAPNMRGGERERTTEMIDTD